MSPATFVDEQGRPISIMIGRGSSNQPTMPFVTASGVSLAVKTNPCPFGSVPVANSSGNVAAASAVATLPGAPGKTTYITGFQITAGGATLGLLVNAALAGLAGGNLTYIYAAIAGVLLISQPLIVTFPIPLAASATNTAITLTLPSLGTGNTNAAVSAQGYQL